MKQHLLQQKTLCKQKNNNNTNYTNHANTAKLTVSHFYF